MFILSLELLFFVLFFLQCRNIGGDGVCNNTTLPEIEVPNVRVPPVQIAFGVMVYQKQGRSVEAVLYDFHNLMEVIYTARNHLYVLHVDVKSDSALIGSIYDDFCGPKPNCLTIMSRNVAWAGLTTGEMMLALMQTAHEAGGSGNSHAYGDRFQEDPLYKNIQGNPIPGHNWSYFVLIGHESVPLVSLPYTEGFLASHPPNTNFMNCMPVGGYDFFGQWEDASSRLEEFHIDNFNGELVDVAWNHDQIKQEAEHGFRERCGGHLGDYTPPVRQPFRRKPPGDIVFYKSIQLMVVSREFVRYASYSLVARRIIMYMMDIKTSDEMFLPTILQSSEYFRSTVSCDSTLHFTHWIRPGGSWHPEYLTLEHLPILLHTHTTHLFVRKLDSTKDSSRRVASVLHRVRSQYLAHFDPVDRDVSVLEKLLLVDNHTATPRIAASMPAANWLVAVATQYICENVVRATETPALVIAELDQSYLNSSRAPVHVAAQNRHRGQLVNPSNLTPLSSSTAVKWTSYCSEPTYREISFDFSDKRYMSMTSGVEATLPTEDSEYKVAPFEGADITATEALTALHIIRMARDNIEIERHFQYWRDRAGHEALERGKVEKKKQTKAKVKPSEAKTRKT